MSYVMQSAVGKPPEFEQSEGTKQSRAEDSSKWKVLLSLILPSLPRLPYIL